MFFCFCVLEMLGSYVKNVKISIMNFFECKYVRCFLYLVIIFEDSFIMDFE